MDKAKLEAMTLEELSKEYSAKCMNLGDYIFRSMLIFTEMGEINLMAATVKEKESAVSKEKTPSA
jgi:hypothetical protein